MLPLIYLYKSLFLIMGGYLAAKTRHVHIPALNDSKFIVWSIYVVVLTSLFTAVLMISARSLEIYVFICLVVLIMTSSILCLVFLPKVSENPFRRLDYLPFFLFLGDSIEVSSWGVARSGFQRFSSRRFSHTTSTHRNHLLRKVPLRAVTKSRAKNRTHSSKHTLHSQGCTYALFLN